VYDIGSRIEQIIEEQRAEGKDRCIGGRPLYETLNEKSVWNQNDVGLGATL
jgi:hypothetical protein